SDRRSWVWSGRGAGKGLLMDCLTLASGGRADAQSDSLSDPPDDCLWKGGGSAPDRDCPTPADELPDCPRPLGALSPTGSRWPGNRLCPVRSLLTALRA